MNSDLVFSTGEKIDPKQGEITFRSGETALNLKPGLRRGTVRTDTIFDGNPAGRVFAKRRINDPAIRGYVAVNDREVFLSGRASLPDSPKFQRGFGIFGHDDDSASLAVQTVHQVRLTIFSEVQPDAAD